MIKIKNAISQVISENTLMSQSRRNFLTYSSMSIIGVAASSVFPASAKTISWLANDSTKSMTNLDNIDFFVMNTNAVPDVDNIDFEVKTDEAQYLSHVMFQEMMKQMFLEQQPTLSSQLRLEPNSAVLEMSDPRDTVYDVYTYYNDYFKDYLAEYISGILQDGYRRNADTAAVHRDELNSWDMVKAGTEIDLAEKGEHFRSLMDRLYAIATHYCQESALSNYKTDDGHWAVELMALYNTEAKLAELISDFKVTRGESQAAFTETMHQVTNTISKVRALNASASTKIDEEELRNFERTLYGAVYSGMAMSMSWGSASKEYSVLWNRANYDTLVGYIQDAGACGSEEQSEYWIAFFNKYSPEQFWSGLDNLHNDLANYSMGDQAAYDIINKRFPPPVSSRSTDLFLQSFAFLLALGHFTWATATDREDPADNPLSVVELGAAFVGTSISIAYDVVLSKLTKLLFGDETPLTDAIVNNLSKYGKYMNNLCTKGRFLINAERRVAENLFFGKTGISSIVEKCFVALAALGAALAAYNLAQAIVDGDVGTIVFAAINMFLAGAAFALSIAAMMGSILAGPLGIVIAVVGIVIAVAQWLYEAFHHEPPPPTPLETYGRQVIDPADLRHQDNGSFLCRARGYNTQTLVSEFNTKTMGTDWEHMSNTVEDRNRDYTQLGALVTSKRTGKIYNFANFQRPKWCNTSQFFDYGADKDIDDWIISSEFAGTCFHAVESVSINSNAALFAAQGKYDHVKLFKTADFDTKPDYDHNIIEIDANQHREYALDIAAVDGLLETMFIVFTRSHIYQLKGNNTLEKVVEYYGDLPPSQTESGNYGMFRMITSVVIDKAVHLFYSLLDDDNETVFHYVLTRDENGDYTKFEMVETQSFNASPSPLGFIVGSQYVEHSSTARIDFFAAGAGTGENSGSTYKRFGAMLEEYDGDKEPSAIALHGGVEYTIPGNCYGFYKNAFIPR